MMNPEQVKIFVGFYDTNSDFDRLETQMNKWLAEWSPAISITRILKQSFGVRTCSICFSVFYRRNDAASPSSRIAG